MSFNLRSMATLALAFATAANCHLIMTKPVPYGKSSLNNSPLVDADPFTSGSGSDYPCKQRPGVYDITSMNHMPVGEPQELSFEGSASHGGGTCQVAVTLDKEPTVDSKFKIIQVFEGGCPVSADGNAGTHPFSFVIPKDFPNGQATLAWVWFNRIGNREMYMNCAPITVTGGSSNQDYFDSLPNLYVINLPTTGSDGCQSTQNYASNSVIIPNPGQFILKESAGQDLAPASGTGCKKRADMQLEGVKGYKKDVIADNGAGYAAPGGSAGGSSGGGASAAPSGGASSYAAPSGGASSYAAPSGGASSAAPSGGASSYAAPSAGASSAAPSGGASSYAAPSGSAAAPSGGASSYAAPSGSAAAPSGFATSSAAASGYPVPSGSASSGSTSGGSCSGSSGAMSCSPDGKQFGVCVNGSTVWRDVAAGTSCSGGAIVRRSEVGGKNPHLRRHVRHAGKHF